MFDEDKFLKRQLREAMVERMDAIPSAKRNAETLAKAAHEACRHVAAEIGMNPDIECMIKAPFEEAYDGAGNRWLVVWESGPYEWGVSLSMALDYGLTEPYYSFDLSFYPAEEYK